MIVMTEKGVFDLIGYVGVNEFGFKTAKVGEDMILNLGP